MSSDPRLTSRNEEDTINIEKLLAIMSMLRDRENGCAWDRKQTFQTIAPHTLEEVYEVLECIENEDYEHLPNELGDLLFQIVFFAQMASEEGLFDFGDIVAEISRKLLSRHPHVFPDATVESFGQKASLTPEQVETNWERIKQAERSAKDGADDGDNSALKDIPLALPAMLRARKLQGRAAHTGFDWPDSQRVLDKIHEEVAELTEAMSEDSQQDREDELGDLLFTVVNLSRHLKIDPEGALRGANKKFEARFRLMEKLAAGRGVDLQSLEQDELEDYWRTAKADLERNKT